MIKGLLHCYCLHDLQAVPAFETLLCELLSGKRKADQCVQTQTQTTNLQEVQHKKQIQLAN